jgi:hypothetical protein
MKGPRHQLQRLRALVDRYEDLLDRRAELGLALRVDVKRDDAHLDQSLGSLIHGLNQLESRVTAEERVVVAELPNVVAIG